MIPDGRYSPQRISQLRDYIVDEVEQAKRARKQKEEAWISFQEAYRAVPAEEEKTFPFTGASNLVIPMIGTDVDTMFTRMMGMLFEADAIFSVRELNPEMAPFAPRMEEFLKWAQHTEIDFQEPIGNWLLDIMKLGTGILKQRYHREMKKVYEWREMGDEVWQQQAIILLKDAPAVHDVRLFDFFVPPGFRTIKDAPWVAERISLTWQQYLSRVKAGIYRGVSAIQQHSANSKGDSVQKEFDRISGYQPTQGNKIPFYEWWGEFDIDGDGWDEALVCTIHIDTREYVRLDFNPFFSQDKPYSSARFMRDENSFYGIGLAEMLIPFQEEVTAMHNQRLDNGTVANSQMFAVRDDNTRITAEEPIYPGKIWLVHNTDDVKPLVMGSTSSAASIQNESFTHQYAARRTGINDYITAQTGPDTSYAPAYVAREMMLNSTKRQGEMVREVRRALSETGTRILEMYQQFNQRGKQYFAMGAKDGMLVSAVLQFPLDLIRRGLKVSITAIDVNESKDAKVRTNSLIMQQMTQYYMQLMQAMMYAANPQTPPPIRGIAMQMIQGSTMLMRRILDSYGEQDADKMLPNLTEGIDVQQQQLAEIQRLIQIANGGGQAGPPGYAPAPGMAGLPPAGPGGPGGGLGAPVGIGGPNFPVPSPGGVGGY